MISIIFENSHYSVDEIIELYTEGYCDYFAKALHDKFGYQIKFLAPDKEAWCHALVYRPVDQKYLDVRGIIDLTEVKKQYGLEGWQTLKAQDVAVFKDYKFDDPYYEILYYNLACKVIEENKELYTL